MQEKIKEIALQVGGSHYPDVGGDRLEKFAQLIINECCNILTDHVEVALDASGGVVYPEGLIKNHFGIAEE